MASTRGEQTDQSINSVGAGDYSLTLDRLDLHARHVTKQNTNRIRDPILKVFHYLRYFQHVVNIAILVNISRDRVCARPTSFMLAAPARSLLSLPGLTGLLWLGSRIRCRIREHPGNL